MRKEKSDYAMVMLPKEVHTMLKEYCSHHNFVMSGFVSALIKQAIANNKRK
jgi:hypothetical protein